MFNFLNSNPQEKANTKFLEAVKRADFNAVQTLLNPTQPGELAAAIDATCPKGYSALYYALSIKNEEASISMLDILLCDKLHIDRLEGPEQTTLLTKAIQLKKTETIKYLFKKNANVNAAKAYQLYPIHAAALANLPDIIRELHARGANITVEASNRNTALHMAAEHKHNDALAALLKINSSQDFLNKQTLSTGQTALITAVRSANLEGVQYLAKAGTNTSLRDHGSHTALDNAIMNNAPITIALLQAGADQRSSYRYTEIPSYRTHVAPFLALNNGLLYAAKEGNFNDLEKSIKSGAFIEFKLYPSKETALFMAAKSGSLECVKFLLNSGANEEPKDSSGETIGSLAAKHQHIELLRFSLDTNRIDLDMNIDGMSLLQFSINKNNLAMLNMLLEKIKNLDNILRYAAEFGNAEILSIILPLTTSQYTETDKAGNTLFHFAMRNKENVIDHIAKAVSKQGINIATMVNDTNMDSLTPLMCKATYFPSVSSLLKHGADTTKRNRDGKMAISIAADQNQRDATIILVYHMLRYTQALDVAMATSFLNKVKLTKRDMCAYVLSLCDEGDIEAKIDILTTATEHNNTPLSKYMHTHATNITVEPRFDLEIRLNELKNSAPYKELVLRKGYQGTNAAHVNATTTAPLASAPPVDPPPPYAPESDDGESSATQKQGLLRFSQDQSKRIQELENEVKELRQIVTNRAAIFK